MARKQPKQPMSSFTDPDTELTTIQRSDLAMLVTSNGYPVIRQILIFIVAQFRVDLDNADQANPADVLAKHALSRAASVVAAKFIARIEGEVNMQREIQKASSPDSPTIPLDDLSTIVEELPNLLGDVHYVEEDNREEADN